MSAFNIYEGLFFYEGGAHHLAQGHFLATTSVQLC